MTVSDSDGGHVCQCRTCCPDVFWFAGKPRINSNHLAVRLGDAGRRIRIMIDGVDCTNATSELLAGADGWVCISTPPLKHPCNCGAGLLCETIVRGHVELGEG